MKSTQNLPERLKELRKKNNYSQEYVAEQLNISRQAISHWENGKAYPDIDNLLLLAELYHMTVDELLDKKEQTVKSDDESAKPDDGAAKPDDEAAKSDDEAAKPEGDGAVKNDDKKGHEILKNNMIIEHIGLAIIIILSLQLPFVPLITAFFITVWMKKNNRKYPVVNILCLICFLAGCFNTFSFIVFFINNYGTPSIEQSFGKIQYSRLYF